MVIKSVMILEPLFAEYYTISLNQFDEEPYKKTGYSKVKNVKEFKPAKGDTFEVKYTPDGMIWTKLANYKEHNFEHAVVLGVKDLQLWVYGNKIGRKLIDDNLTIHNNPESPKIYEYKRGDELLLEINKKIRIVHNITAEKMVYNERQNWPHIR